MSKTITIEIPDDAYDAWVNSLCEDGHYDPEGEDQGTTAEDFALQYYRQRLANDIDQIRHNIWAVAGHTANKVFQDQWEAENPKPAATTVTVAKKAVALP